MQTAGIPTAGTSGIEAALSNTYLCIREACTDEDRRRIEAGFGSLGGRGG